MDGHERWWLTTCEHCGREAECRLGQHGNRYLWHCGRIDNEHPPLVVTG